MMKRIPWETRASDFLQNIFIAVENARIQGIGEVKWVTVIV